jgi:hypothetical protein
MEQSRFQKFNTCKTVGDMFGRRSTDVVLEVIRANDVLLSCRSFPRPCAGTM